MHESLVKTIPPPHSKVYTNFSSTNASKESTVSTASLVEFDKLVEANYYFALATSLNASPNILRVHCLGWENNKYFVMVNHIHSTYANWCSLKRDMLQNLISKGYKTRCAIEMKSILIKLTNILSGVVKGLMYIFEHQQYHGNLSHGIVVADGNKSISYIYNMKKIEGPLLENQVNDIRDLEFIVKTNHWHPNGNKSGKNEALTKFQERLGNSLLLNHTSPAWVIFDIMFWTDTKKSNFMNIMHQILFVDGQISPKDLSVHLNWDWRLEIHNCQNQTLKKSFELGKGAYNGPNGTTAHVFKYWNDVRAHYNNYHDRVESETSKTHERVAKKGSNLTGDEIDKTMEDCFKISAKCYEGVNNYLMSGSANPLLKIALGINCARRLSKRD